jgi:Peroxiredoxin
MQSVLSIGSNVEDFTLDDQFDKPASLLECRGKKVLLSFHPLAWTGICTKQMQNLDAAYEAFAARGVIPFGLSVDAVPAKKAWSDSMQLKRLRLLSDFWPHGGLAAKLGIFMDDEGISRRANILIDETGAVMWTKVYEMATLPDFEEILSLLKA